MSKSSFSSNTDGCGTWNIFTLKNDMIITKLERKIVIDMMRINGNEHEIEKYLLLVVLFWYCVL